MTIMKASLGDILDSNKKFWFPKDVEGGCDTLMHLAETEELRMPYEGVFWRGPKTRYGMANPPTELLLSIILPHGGWGYSGHSAANGLGLSTQMPRNRTVATPFMPAGGELEFVEFIEREGRNGRSRHKLSIYEVSLLEILNGIIAGESCSELDYQDMMKSIRDGLRMRTEIGIAVIPRLLAGAMTEPREVRTLLKEVVFH